MQGVDLIGVQNIANYIIHNKMNYFYIHRHPANQGALPIYESYRNRNPKEASDDFQQWAIFMNPDQNPNIYVITVVDYDESKADNPRSQKSKKNKATFVFHHQDNGFYASQQQQNKHSVQPAMNGYTPEFIAQMMKDSEERAYLRSENARLKEKVEDLEDELDELGEENPQQDTWDHIDKTLDRIDKLEGKKNKTVEPNQQATLSGLKKDADRYNMLKKSIQVLNKYDSRLPEHLFILAKLAVEDNAKFQTLIGMLDNM
jgi:hypothetical protein